MGQPATPSRRRGRLAHGRRTEGSPRAQFRMRDPIRPNTPARYRELPAWKLADVHEMAITQSVVDAVCVHAAGRRVHSVRVEVGALCAVMPDSMQFCFGLASEGTIADGARLDLDVRPGAARCRTCGDEFALADLILLCPCGSADVEVIAGRDLKILSMEVS